MTSTIYRKYRPQFFSEVIGQEHVTKTLQNEIVANKLAHAYLFCGIRGVGKTTLARLLAKALNCQKRKKEESEPCDKCQSCLAIKTGTSLDLVELDAASNRRIDDIREIKEHIPYGPVTSNFKIVIIDEVHMLTAEAFNALLKTLEEPPTHTIFVLATTEVHKLPETIISRCQRFDFHKVSARVMVGRLSVIIKAEGVKVDDEVLLEIARLAGGSTRDAESMLGKLLSLGKKKISITEASLVLPRSDINVALKLLKMLVEKNGSLAIELINNFYDEGGDLDYLHNQVTELMRKLLLIKLGGGLSKLSSYDLSAEQETDLSKLAQMITGLQVQEILEEWLKVQNLSNQTDIIQLPLEMAIVAITERSGGNYPQTFTSASVLKSEPVKEVKQEPRSEIPVTGGELSGNWQDLVDKLKVYNHSLSFILSSANLAGIEGEKLIVDFNYKLHFERVNSVKIKKVVDDAIKEVYGRSLKFTPRLAEQTTGKDDLLSTVLSTFGGKLS